MLALGSLTAIQAVATAAGAATVADKRQIIAAVRQAIGLPEDQPAGPTVTTGTVLTVADAARRLSRSTSTIKWYCASGKLRGIRTGRSRRLTGVPATEIDAFIAANLQAEAPHT
jgi:excisionase family DNA binding protein